MQNVAWPRTIVQKLKGISTRLNAERSEIPVMIPGKAIGRITRSDTVSRPKKRECATWGKGAREDRWQGRQASTNQCREARKESDQEKGGAAGAKNDENHCLHSHETKKQTRMRGAGETERGEAAGRHVTIHNKNT